MAHISSFGERGGFGRRPALAVIDMTLGFTDPESPLACDLEELVENIVPSSRARPLATETPTLTRPTSMA